MKAIVYKEYGSAEVLKRAEIEKPTIKSNEVLVKIKASTVSAGTILMRRGSHPSSKFFTLVIRLMSGLKKPKKEILGYEFSGEIVEVGSSVSRFKLKDHVFGTTTNLQAGAYAEYVAVPEHWKNGVIELKPKNASFEEAAALPIGSMTALYLLNKVKNNDIKKVLVYGASGSVGSFAIQLCKLKGSEVTAVCSEKNFDMVKELGADKVIDYTKQNIAVLNEKYDLIFDAVGKISKSLCKTILNTNGEYLSVNSPTKESQENLSKLKEYFERNKIKSYIDKIYSLDDVSKAHEYCDSGHKRGNVVIRVE